MHEARGQPPIALMQTGPRGPIAQQSGRPKKEPNLYWSDPQPGVAQDKSRAAICVQNVDVHVSCSSHADAQLAAVFIDPRAKGSTGMVCIIFRAVCFPKRYSQNVQRHSLVLFPRRRPSSVVVRAP